MTSKVKISRVDLMLSTTSPSLEPKALIKYPTQRTHTGIDSCPLRKLVGYTVVAL